MVTERRSLGWNALRERRLWGSLALAVPVVGPSHMVMDWFGYELSFCSGPGANMCSLVGISAMAARQAGL